MTPVNSRDVYICQDYLDGKEVTDLARTYGLTGARISQILRAAGIKRREPKRRDKPAISKLHVKIGLHLYQYRQDNGIELSTVANDLELSAIRIRNIEKGKSEIELLDLINIATYTDMDLTEILKG